MDTQKVKARELADRGRCIQNADGTWTVFSLSSNNKYKVVLNGKNPRTEANNYHTCTCPHFELIQAPCKHVRACLAVVAQDISDRKHEREPRERVAEGEPIQHKRPTYKQLSWENYNAAQTNEKDFVQELLANLCGTIPEPPRKPGKGRKPIPLSTMVFCAIFKVYVGMSARRGTCDLEEAERRGHILQTPHFNRVLSVLDKEETTPILYELIRLSALPLAAVETTFATDSTGFCTNTYTRFYDVKYGISKQEAKYVKLHASVGVSTNVVTAALILDQDTGDSPQLPHLTKETAKGFTVKEMTSDKAYTSVENFEAVNGVGGQLYSAFKVNASGAVGGLFEKAYLLFRLNKEDYMKHYHQRSNAESTFSAVKRKMGGSVKSKSDTAQRNEVLAKVVAYNLTCLVSAWYELGIESAFGAALPEPEEDEAPAILRFQSGA
jgi:transposase